MEGRLRSSNSKPPRGQECTRPAKSTWGEEGGGRREAVEGLGDLFAFSGRERGEKKTHKDSI